MIGNFHLVLNFNRFIVINCQFSPIIDNHNFECLYAMLANHYIV